MILLQAPRFFVIYDSQFPLASSRFGRESIQYRVGKTHCQGHQDPSKRVSIFLGETEALIKMVSINRVSISRSRTVYAYSTTPRNGNPVNGNHLDQSLSFSQKNGNSLIWVLVALPVCPTSPLRLRDSAEPRPNLELASGNCES